jgi:hypothetical protein
VQGLYIAPVAKSTITPGTKRRTSRIKAPARTSLWGCPGAGFVLWQEDTGPQNTVAHDGRIMLTNNTEARILIFIFFITIILKFINELSIRVY